MRVQEIQPYKGRTIDLNKKVKIYRCLNRKGQVYSIQQGSYVVGHATHLFLKDCKFKVSQSGCARCKEKQERNVHAHIECFISKEEAKSPLNVKVTYNPYKNTTFIANQPGHKPRAIYSATEVIINNKGVSALI